ncbi:MAG TPA: hypothetical protein VJY65_13690 [Chloroflexota bacterium]|nr:hypothetical protein [Chloroflexota bacterium]
MTRPSALELEAWAASQMKGHEGFRDARADLIRALRLSGLIALWDYPPANERIIPHGTS